MRNNFAHALTQLAAHNEQLVLLYSDSGNRLFNPLKEVIPDKVVNVGIAEANMISVASGIAQNGFIPLTYAITPFTSARNFEQIKVDVAYPNLPIIIVGTGSGLAYANLGPTHHSFEDIALMRALPNMQIVCPSDSQELKALLPQVIESGKPTYFRIGKKREPDLIDDTFHTVLGEPTVVTRGEQLVIVATGPILSVALEIESKLRESGISCEVVSMHTIKPLNVDFLTNLTNRHKKIVTLEEHSVIGGLGSALLEFFCDNEFSVSIKRFGIKDEFLDKCESQQNALDKLGLNANSIIKELIEWL